MDLIVIFIRHYGFMDLILQNFVKVLEFGKLHRQLVGFTWTCVTFVSCWQLLTWIVAVAVRRKYIFIYHVQYTVHYMFRSCIHGTGSRSF